LGIFRFLHREKSGAGNIGKENTKTKGKQLRHRTRNIIRIFLHAIFLHFFAESVFAYRFFQFGYMIVPKPSGFASRIVI